MSRDDSNFEKLSPLKRAFLALEEAQSKLKVLERRFRQPIAIVGTGCRIPGGVADAQSYWDLLCKETDTIREVPADRWDIDAYLRSRSGHAGKDGIALGRLSGRHRRNSIRVFSGSRRARHAHGSAAAPAAGGRLGGAGERGAVRRPRLAGADTASSSGSAAAITCTSCSHMARTCRASTPTWQPGIAHSVAARAGCRTCWGCRARASSVDTACSSSLVAVHLACRALRAGECDTGAGGRRERRLLSPETTMSFSHGAHAGAGRPLQGVRCRGRRLRARRGLRRRGAEAASRCGGRRAIGCWR